MAAVLAVGALEQAATLLSDQQAEVAPHRWLELLLAGESTSQLHREQEVTSQPSPDEAGQGPCLPQLQQQDSQQLEQGLA